LVKNSLII